MNKAQFIDEIAAVADLPKTVSAQALDAMLEVLTKALVKGDAVALMGFGTFSSKIRAAREGRNPQTGETIQIKESRVVNFKAGKALKDAMAESEEQITS